MPSVIEQCTSALHQGHFADARALACEALAVTAAPAVRLPLLEVLAQAQTGLQDHAAAAQTWQQAYEQATMPADTTRLFERLCLAHQHLRDYPVLLCKRAPWPAPLLALPYPVLRRVSSPRVVTERHASPGGRVRPQRPGRTRAHPRRGGSASGWR